MYRMLMTQIGKDLPVYASNVMDWEDNRRRYACDPCTEVLKVNVTVQPLSITSPDRLPSMPFRVDSSSISSVHFRLPFTDA